MDWKLTAAGRAAMSYCIAEGKPIVFTRVMMGTGTSPDGTAIAEPLAELPNGAKIISVEREPGSNDAIVISMVYNNSTFAVERTITEVGIFILDPEDDESEKLFMCGSGTFLYIPASTSAYEGEERFRILLDDGAEAAVLIDDSLVFALKSDFLKHVAEYKEHINAYNPHGINFTTLITALPSSANIDNLQDGLYTIDSDTLNAPFTGTGFLIQTTSATGVRNQLAIHDIENKPDIFKRLQLSRSRQWSAWTSMYHSPELTGIPTAPDPPGSANNTQIATTHFVMNAVQSVSFGMYTGDGTDARFIATHFHPRTVEIWREDGVQTEFTSSGNIRTYGGLAFEGNPLKASIYAANDTHAAWVNTGAGGSGFCVSYESATGTDGEDHGAFTNQIGVKYYYKVYYYPSV